MGFGMDVGNKSKQTIFHNNLQNIKLSPNKSVHLRSINFLQPTKQINQGVERQYNVNIRRKGNTRNVD